MIMSVEDVRDLIEKRYVSAGFQCAESGDGHISVNLPVLVENLEEFVADVSRLGVQIDLHVTQNRLQIWASTARKRSISTSFLSSTTATILFSVLLAAFWGFAALRNSLELISPG